MGIAVAFVLATLAGPPCARGATFVVTTTADSGFGSLRQAILDANATSGANAIVFAIPTLGVPRIAPATALPTLIGPVTIDGTTQVMAGWVELDGGAITSAAGLTLTGGSSTVRGLVIHGFGTAGIVLGGLGGNVVEGNRIGCDVSGTQALSPLAYGIEIVGSPANRIGGTSPGSGNLLSGNLFGIFVHGSAAVGNVIEGNLVGTDASGMVALPNTATGIWIFGASQTVVGGADPAAGNVIAGNATDGVDVGGANGVDTAISGNAIGLAADLGTPLGNGEDGIYLYAGAARSNIGSLAANWIGTNGGAGVKVESSAGARNAIRGNVIVANTGLGIDLGAAGVTENDPGDADGGANDQQNFPVLDAGFTGGTQVAGTLDSVANGSFTLEVFATSDCDPSGHGEGAELLAVQAVTTDGVGHGEFTAALSRNVDASLEYVTATVTDALGNTSEFSPCTPATLLPTTTTSTTTSSTVTTTTASSTTSTTAVSSTTSTTEEGGTSTTTSTTVASSSTTSTTVPGSTTTTTTLVSTTTSTSLPSSSTTSTSLPSSSTTSTTVPEETTTTTTSTSLPSSSTTSTSLPSSSTTSTTSTTIIGSSTTSSTTSTSTPAATSTTTTLPGSCPVEPNFGSIECRLVVLRDTVPGMWDLGTDRELLGRQLVKAGLLVGRADARCQAAKAGPARHKLFRVGRRLRRVLRVLRAHYAHRVPPIVAVASLTDTTAVLLDDTRTLARRLTCP